MFSLLWEAIIGLIVGALAKFIMPGKDPGGIFITMLIGVAGALLATFVGSHIGLYQEGQRAGFLMSLLGAIAARPLSLNQGQNGDHLAPRGHRCGPFIPVPPPADASSSR
jgi:uncharacterized membrane protein YeaQ/YmgE (transglycosylase-associated protein family)